MNVVAFFVPHAEPAEFEQPGEDPFHDPPMFAQAAAMFRVAFGNEGLNSALAQRPANLFLGVVGAIGERRVRPLAATATRTFDGRESRRSTGSRLANRGRSPRCA